MAAAGFVGSLAIFLALSSSFSYAYDDDPWHDFCVAEPDATAAVIVNGKICKNPKLVTPDDFLASGFNIPGNTSKSPIGFAVNYADVNRIPGLNTLGLSIGRADIAPNAVAPPHIHPRASEIIVVLEGTVYFGFVTSNPTDNTKNKLFAKVLKPGDVFVIPAGLVHFARNVGNTKAVVFAAFNSQSRGLISIPNSVFGTEPEISPEVLAKSFQLDKKLIDYLQSRF